MSVNSCSVCGAVTDNIQSFIPEHPAEFDNCWLVARYICPEHVLDEDEWYQLFWDEKDGLV